MEYCCWNCFDDEYLRVEVRKKGQVQQCLLCENSNRRALDIDSLCELFAPVVALYSDVEDYMPLFFLKEGAGEHPTLSEQFVGDWGIFEDEYVAAEFFGACCEPYHPRHNPGPDMFDPARVVGDSELFFLDKYSEQTRLEEKWNQLKDDIKRKRRFFAGRDMETDFSNALSLVEAVLARETRLYRSRSCDPNHPHSPDNMGAPPPAVAMAGRANPAGIPFLYLASERETAAAELRPHVGDSLTIGTFLLNKEQRIADLRLPMIGSPFRWGSKLQSAVRVMGFLKKLGDELSGPIADNSKEQEYLPTQFLCELIKENGYDGVGYKSGLGDGYNVVLFDTNSARCDGTKLVRVEKVEIKLSRSSTQS